MSHRHRCSRRAALAGAPSSNDTSLVSTVRPPSLFENQRFEVRLSDNGRELALVKEVAGPGPDMAFQITASRLAKDQDPAWEKH